VRRRIQKEGRIKGPLSLSTLSRLANEWLHDHPQLLAEAAERAAELFG
jgi:phage FluMu protein gp41